MWLKLTKKYYLKWRKVRGACYFLRFIDDNWITEMIQFKLKLHWIIVNSLISLSFEQSKFIMPLSDVAP